jgi:hypothetical protein
MKYVWLNLNTGEFSNSWNEEQHKETEGAWTEESIDNATKSGWKLLQYSCLNDPSFELYDRMKLK